MDGKKKINGENMHPINKAVKELLITLDECGIADSPVILTPDYDLEKCAYERGVPVQVIFGGRSAVFVSEEPLKATTKASFMAEASLKKVAQRAAAAGIINAVMGFLCKIRRLHACRSEDHAPCRQELSKLTAGKSVCCIGEMPDARRIVGSLLTEDPDKAELILISGDGLVSESNPDTESYPQDKIIYIGPSTAGTANILHYHHFCPFGRANLQKPEE